MRTAHFCHLPLPLALEFTGKLCDDAVAQDIRHMQNVLVDLVELANIIRIVAVEPGAGLRERKVQVHSHFGLHIRLRPVFGIGTAQECGDLIAFLCAAQCGYITGQNIVNDGGVYQGLF